MTNHRVASVTLRPEHVPKKPTAFDPYVIPATKDASALVDQVIYEAMVHEFDNAMRQRKRRPADQERFERSIAALISGAAVAFMSLSGPKRSVRVRADHLGERTGVGKPPYMTKTFKDHICLLADMRWLIFTKGATVHVLRKDPNKVPELRHISATLEAGPKLIGAIEQRGLSQRDFQTDLELHEPIILRGPKCGKSRGPLLQYQDTQDTHHMRDRMEDLNLWLAEADIFFDHAKALPMFKPEHSLPDWEGKALARIFNDGTFKHGGRLYGGFWEGLPKPIRRTCLTIDGGPVAEVDFHAMHAHLAYAHIGVQAPTEGDLYDIGLQPAEGFDQREGVKKFFQAKLNKDCQSTHMPRGCREYFPKHVKAGCVDAAIEARHPALKPIFNTKVGMKLQRQDADIMISILQHLQMLGVTALPLHDGVIAPLAEAECVKTVMEQEYSRLVGFTCRADIAWPK